VINKYKMGKHFTVTITDTTLVVARKQAQIDAEAALDGIYVLRTSVPAAQLDAPGVVFAYKNLAHIERDFRIVRSTIWTCVPSTTGSKTASKHTELDTER
jgi:hypothetical protein